jgi:outer membrane protein assembly factor BamE
VLRVKVVTLILTAAISAAFLSSCYRIPVNQGNRLEPSALKRLKIGMTREQVHYLMGTPVLQDPFDQSRWSYVSRFKTKSGEYMQHTFILDFTGDTLTKITGDDKAFEEPKETGDKNEDAEETETPDL